MTKDYFQTLWAVVLIGWLAPVKATGQDILQIHRARTAVAIGVTGRSLPRPESLPGHCGATSGISSDVTGRIADALAGAVSPELPKGLVLITATTQTKNHECGATPDQRAVLTAAAIELQRPEPHAAITRLDVAVGDQIITPTFARTIRTVPLWMEENAPSAGRARAPVAASTALQIGLPLDHFDPTADTTTHAVALLISRQGEANVERIPLSAADVDALWRLALPLRAARAGADSSWVVDIAHAAALEAKELPVAAVMLKQFGDGGDRLAASAIARHALTVEPCLRFPANATRQNVLLDSFRPRARCRASHAAVTALRGTLIPGLGQASSKWRTIGGVIVFGLVAQRLHASQTSKRDGRAYYQRYVNATSNGEANTYWTLADQARRRTDAQIAQASTLWIGALAEATWHEWRLGRRLRRVAPIALPAESR